jgi:hypothetical protein
MADEEIRTLSQRIDKIESLINRLLRKDDAQTPNSVGNELVIKVEKFHESMRIHPSEYLTRLKQGFRSYEDYTDSIKMALRALRGDDSIAFSVPCDEAKRPKRKPVVSLPDSDRVRPLPDFPVLKKSEPNDPSVFHLKDSQMKLNFPTNAALNQTPAPPLLNPTEPASSDSGMGQFDADNSASPEPLRAHFLESMPDEDYDVPSGSGNESDLEDGDISSPLERSDVEREGMSSELGEDEEVAPSGFIFQSQRVSESAIIGECENQYSKINAITRLKQ